MDLAHRGPPSPAGSRDRPRVDEAAEARLASLGCVKINLQVAASNAGTADFYARCGYAVEERISMSKLLRGP